MKKTLLTLAGIFLLSSFIPKNSSANLVPPLDQKNMEHEDPSKVYPKFQSPEEIVTQVGHHRVWGEVRYLTIADVIEGFYEDDSTLRNIANRNISLSELISLDKNSHFKVKDLEILTTPIPGPIFFPPKTVEFFNKKYGEKGWTILCEDPEGELFVVPQD